VSLDGRDCEKGFEECHLEGGRHSTGQLSVVASGCGKVMVERDAAFSVWDANVGFWEIVESGGKGALRPLAVVWMQVEGTPPGEVGKQVSCRF
jgi:hypothetical protein